MKKKFLAAVLASVMAFGLVACGNSGAGTETAKTSGGSDGLIKVGIINNDPNESGYRTANDKDLKATFSAENGYDASFICS